GGAEPAAGRRSGHAAGGGDRAGDLARRLGPALAVRQPLRQLLGGVRIAGRGDRADALVLPLRLGDPARRRDSPRAGEADLRGALALRTGIAGGDGAGDAAARGELGFDPGPDRLASGAHVLEDAVHGVLVEDA